MQSVLQDLVVARRGLMRNPGFTAVAVLTLTLGIGSNTTIFSVVHALLIAPLPFQDLERIVGLWESNPAKGHTRILARRAARVDPLVALRYE